MDRYKQIVKDFSALPQVRGWPELKDFFQRIASLQPGHWLLPLWACEAVGGNPLNVNAALVAVACEHVSIVLVDDMLDADPRGEYRKVGEAAAANMACAFQSIALTRIAESEMDLTLRLTALESVNEMFLATTIGQYRDVQKAEIDEQVYWEITKAKSSPFFGAAFHLGALAGGASLEVAGRIKELGKLYGEMIQIHDDLHDAMEIPANPDWKEGRSPLPILFARLVNHPARARFEKLRQKAGTNEKSLREAQEILIQCGAVSYCVDQLLSRYEIVRKSLAAESIVRPSALIRLFEEIVMPVWKLFDAAGEKPFA